MKFQVYSEKLATIQLYIEKRWATTPQELSKKLDINERTVLRMVSALKDKGLNIEYSKLLKQYIIKD